MLLRLKKQVIILLLLLLQFCCGCFTMQIDKFCERCHEDIIILERRCEWAQDGESFTVYCRKRIDYCQNPFKNNSGSEEIALSHTYSLTTPEPDAMLYSLSLVPDIDARRIGVSGEAFADIEDGHPRYKWKVDYNRLALPKLYSWENLLNKPQIRLSVHPDDLPLFQKPFLIDSNILAIPYKTEGNVCLFYVPKDNIVTEISCWRMPNTHQKTLKRLLAPPAAILDIVTSPVQICISVLDILTGANICPYP